MQKLTSEQLREKFIRLPQDLRDAVFSEEISATITAIGKKHNFLLDKTGELDDETMNVVFGITHPRDFISNLEKRLGVNRSLAGEIANEINQQIFSKLRESLKKVHKIEDEFPDQAPADAKAFTNAKALADKLAGRQDKPKIPFSDLKSKIPFFPAKDAPVSGLKNTPDITETKPAEEKSKIFELKTASPKPSSDFIEKKSALPNKPDESKISPPKPPVSYAKPQTAFSPPAPAKKAQTGPESNAAAPPASSIFEARLKDQIFHQKPEETKKELKSDFQKQMDGLTKSAEPQSGPKKNADAPDPYLLEPELHESKPKDRTF